MLRIEPITLAGRLARLEPLGPHHLQDLQQATADGTLSNLWYTSVPTADGMAAEIERRHGLQAAGSMLPFTVIRQGDDKAVGMTTYMNIDAINDRLEIGSTWIGSSAQGTGINAECKLMLLTHAFETLGCIAVEFRTHFMNRQSRAAIERLGTKQDGILRSHMRLPNGTVRDTVVYSIIASEWPAVRANLEHRLSRHSG